MQTLLGMLWEGYEAYLKDAHRDNTMRVYHPGGEEGSMERELDMVAPFFEWAEGYLRTIIATGQVIMTIDRQQVSINDVLGDGEMPKSYAVHAIGKPIKTKDVDDINTVRVNG